MTNCLFLVLVRQAALATVVAIEVRRHEHASAAVLVRAFPPQASDLAIVVNPVELQDRQRVLLVLVLNLLRLGVVLSNTQKRNLVSPTARAHSLAAESAGKRTFFFRFLPPPRSRNTRWRVDSFWML